MRIRFMLPPVIVLIADQNNVFALECERETPVTVDGNGPALLDHGIKDEASSRVRSCLLAA